LLKASYAASFGRLKALWLNFLKKEKLYELAQAKDLAEIAEKLEDSWYGADIEAAASVYKPPELIEVAVNRHLITVNRLAIQVVPLFGRNMLLSYLSKWDIENIELIVAAKSTGRGLEETESFLVSARNIPVALSGSLIPFSELKAMLQMPDVESVLNTLVRYGYGGVLLQQLPELRRTGDLGILSGALQSAYYSRLLWELRFLKGDEGTLREYIRAEIAKKNILNLLKSKEAGLSKDVFERHIVQGGLIGAQSLLEAYSTDDFGELVKRFVQWFDLSDALERYRRTANLTEFEVSIDRLLVKSYISRFRSLSLSVSSVFAFVLQAEIERQNIRRITYGKLYSLPEEYIKSILLVE
jgi:V/A-type H+-transporting ATPase subunit C